MFAGIYQMKLFTQTWPGGLDLLTSDLWSCMFFISGHGPTKPALFRAVTKLSKLILLGLVHLILLLFGLITVILSAHCSPTNLFYNEYSWVLDLTIGIIHNQFCIYIVFFLYRLPSFFFCPTCIVFCYLCLRVEMLLLPFFYIFKPPHREFIWV